MTETTKKPRAPKKTAAEKAAEAMAKTFASADAALAAHLPAGPAKDKAVRKFAATKRAAMMALAAH